MVFRPVKVCVPSYPRTLLFLAGLVPACCWGVVLLGISLLSLLTDGPSLHQAVSLACGLALLLPVPFVARGLRAAVLPVIFSLLGSLLFCLNMELFRQSSPILVLSLFALGGIYCMVLAHLFRRARPLLETVEKRQAVTLGVLCLAAAAELYPAFIMSVTAPSHIVLLGEAAFILSFVLFAAALPGLLLPRLSLLAACLGLVHALSSLGAVAWEVYTYRWGSDLPGQSERFAVSFASQRGMEAVGVALFLAGLFCLTLWLLRRAKPFADEEA